MPEDLELDKYADSTFLIPGKYDSWMNDLMAAEDIHSMLKVGILNSDHILRKLFEQRGSSNIPWEDLVEPMYANLLECGKQAMLGGRSYAISCLPDLTKSAQIFNWDITKDIDEMITGMGIPANKKAARLIHEHLMESLPPPIHELSQMMDFEQAKAIARTVMMNIYVKSALRRWDEDGIIQVRRMEMRDKKTCPICRALNGKLYDISDLLGRIYPLSEDTHPNCRGTFIPIISLATYSPKQRSIPLAVDIQAGKSTATNVPVELQPWLSRFLRQFPDTVDIEFDPRIPEAYSWKASKVKINPDALVDQDVREIILEALSDQLWPKLEEKFKKEYLPLITAGLAHPAKSFTTQEELFANNYIQYRMGQDQDPWSIEWWSRNA